MIKIDVKFDGIVDNVEVFFQEKTKAVKDAVNEAALNIQKDAKQRSRVKTGRLRASIVIEPATVDRMALRVGTYVKYAAGVEFGTRPHEIRPKNKKALFWKGARHPVKVVKHPGTRAKPFLFPAFEAEKPKFERALREAMK